jgi:Spy/CpxP family protein refolding chaperone
MKLRTMIATGLVALLMAGALAVAAEDAGDEGGRLPRRDRSRRDDGRRRNRRPRRDRHGPWQLLRRLDLTEDQKEQIGQIMETHRQAMENLKKELGDRSEARKQFREAKKAGDEETLAKLKEQYKDARASMKELHEELRKKIAAVLTEEQQARLKELMEDRGPGERRHPLAGLELSEDQTQAVKAIHEKYREQIKQADGREARHELMKKMHEEVVGQLTEEQRAQLEKRRQRMAQRREGRFDGLDLSEEQREAIGAIRTRYREQFKEAEGKEARRELFKKMRGEITEQLTEEQRQQLRERFGNRRRDGERRPHRRRGPARGAAEE